MNKETHRQYDMANRKLAEKFETGPDFTPGPWKASKWATGWTVSATDYHYSVCHLEGCNNADANARLIAAAPDLLQALKMLCPLTHLQTCKGLRYIPLCTAEREEHCTCGAAKARAAIAKATGKGA